MQPESLRNDTSLGVTEDIRLEFLARYGEDLAQRIQRPLSEYLKHYPGHEEIIALEWAAPRLDPSEIEAVVSTQDDGQRIGPYRLEERLGQGGQGTVHRALDTRLERWVALKLMDLPVSPSSARRARFRREAETAANLPHPGICQVLEAGIEKGVAWIAMELIEGQTLKARIAAIHGQATTDLGSATRRETPRERVRETLVHFEKIARALHFAHERGVLHRDIKPGNIMLTPQMEPKILDFGLAWRATDGTSPLTQTGDLMGTLPYLAPERLDDPAPPPDRAMDLWALSVSLYEALFGERPFQGSSFEALTQSIRWREPDRLARTDGRVPRDLITVLRKALDKDPTRRYANAAELADDLGRIIACEPVHARPVSPWTRLARWATRHPALASQTALFTVGLLAATAWTSIKNEELRNANEKLSSALQQGILDRKKIEAGTQALHRTSDPQVLKLAEEDADLLWPRGPELQVEIDAWRARYADIFLRFTDHRQALAALIEDAPLLSDAEFRAAWPERADDLQAAQADCAQLQSKIAETEEPLQRASLELELAARSSERDRLRAERLGARGRRLEPPERAREAVRLDDHQRRVQHHLEAPDGLFARLEQRIEDSERLWQRTVAGEVAAQAWQEARARITAHPAYAGFDLAPQPGLLPLGPDPTSGLEEFLHLETHADALLPTWAGIARAAPEAAWTCDGRSGVVLVLVPGGRLQMGAQAEDPAAPQFDPAALDTESPVHEVALDPFMIGKFELTQGQWERGARAVTGLALRPSTFGSGTQFKEFQTEPIHLGHPVESVNHEELLRWAKPMRLGLPTEAQWEWAARGGAPSTRWPGCEDPDTDRLLANLGGREFGAARQESAPDPRHDDGFVLTSPVGSFPANGFGLFDVCGNVFELVRELRSHYDVPPRAGDGQRPAPRREHAVVRGGAFQSPREVARVSARGFVERYQRNWFVGGRVVFELSRPAR